MSGFTTNNCFNLVVYCTCGECGRLCGSAYAGIGSPSATRDNLYSARPTKRCLALYTTANRVHDIKVRRYAEDNKTEQNQIVRTGK